MTADLPLVDYYARRAAEYERIYAKPERRADLGQLRHWVENFATGRRILEVACGTGWWTEVLAATAKLITALDINEEVLAIARQKTLPRTRLLCRDLYSLELLEESFEAGFAGFWWSHVPRTQLGEFLERFHRQLEPNATVLFLDNRFVPGSSTPISRTDSAGDTFQTRRLADGSESEVLKNFPGPEELEAVLRPLVENLQIRLTPHYWCLTYRSL